MYKTACEPFLSLLPAEDSPGSSATQLMKMVELLKKCLRKCNRTILNFSGLPHSVVLYVLLKFNTHSKPLLHKRT